MSDLFLTSFNYYQLHELYIGILENKLPTMGYDVSLVPVVDNKTNQFSHIVAVSKDGADRLVTYGNDNHLVLVKHVTNQQDAIYRLTHSETSPTITVVFEIPTTYFGFIESVSFSLGV